MTRLINRQPWLPYVVTGLALQVAGFIIGAYGYWHNNDLGENSHSAVGITIGSLIGGLGFWAMVAGVIALGVQVALRSPAGRGNVDEAPMSTRPGSPAPIPVDLAALAADPHPFADHPGDSDTVAEVRRECGRGTSRSTIRKIVNKAAREQRLDRGDHALIEALLDEADRRAAVAV